MMRWPLALMVFALTIAAHAETSVFQPKGWRFRADLPGKPEVTENASVTALGPVLRTKANCLQHGAVFLVSREAAGFVQSATAYRESEDVGLQNPSAEKQVDEKATIGGHEGRRVVVVDGATKLRRESLVVVVGKELYVFSYQATPAVADEAEAQAFFASIRAQEP